MWGKHNKQSVLCEKSDTFKSFLFCLACGIAILRVGRHKCCYEVNSPFFTGRHIKTSRDLEKENMGYQLIRNLALFCLIISQRVIQPTSNKQVFFLIKEQDLAGRSLSGLIKIIQRMVCLEHASILESVLSNLQSLDIVLEWSRDNSKSKGTHKLLQVIDFFE